MAKPTDEWFGQAFGKAWKDKSEEIGRFNLAIFGKTGVGKSTLVNAIFGSEIAKTGIGEPVTRAEHLYLHPSGATTCTGCAASRSPTSCTSPGTAYAPETAGSRRQRPTSSGRCTSSGCR